MNRSSSIPVVLLVSLLWLSACGGDFQPAPTVPSSSQGSRSQAWTLPKLCTSNHQCKSSEYCKKPYCAATLGTCVSKPASCFLVPQSYVRGCNHQSYANACLAAQAGQSIFLNEFQARVSDNQCSGTVLRNGLLKSRLSAFSVGFGESGRWAMSTFQAPAGKNPYYVKGITYQLLNQATLLTALGPNTQGCNAGLSHKVRVYTVGPNGVFTHPGGVISFANMPTTSAQVVPSQNITRDMTLNFSPAITLTPGTTLLVAIEMNRINQNNRLCLSQCYQETAEYRDYKGQWNGQHFSWVSSTSWGGQHDAFRFKLKVSY
jgi:hypothetical protein